MQRPPADWPLRWVLASGNPGKLREFRKLLEPLGIELIAQSELGIDEAEEPHHTFVENALAKARHVARCAGMPALADDSGLCVTALDFAPGVRSARYAAQDVPAHSERGVLDAANNRRLLAELAPHADRSARFCCVLVLLRSAADPLPVIAQGEWDGHIALAPAGDGGFGYDPLFVPDAAQQAPGLSAAQLAPAVKNRVSHRGQAFERLLAQVRLAGARASAGARAIGDRGPV